MNKSLRKAGIAGNWKMNKTPAEAKELLEAIKPLVQDADCDVVACVPYVDLCTALETAKGSNIGIGAENCHWEASGAYTGEISAPMLKDLGCSYVICGHSERRQILGESDELVARKVKAVLSHDMIPILCVGETGEERKEGQTEERIGSEIRTALFELSKEEAAKVVIAYEPIWAIGSGKAATPEDAEEIASFIRKTVKETAGKKASEEVRILYGGSVNGDNMSHFLKQKDIDGALIGGASLKPETMIDIYSKA